jgi:hypothetical protein
MVVHLDNPADEGLADHRAAEPAVLRADVPEAATRRAVLDPLVG